MFSWLFNDNIFCIIGLGSILKRKWTMLDLFILKIVLLRFGWKKSVLEIGQLKAIFLRNARRKDCFGIKFEKKTHSGRK